MTHTKPPVRQKSGGNGGNENVHQPQTFIFKEMEIKPMRKFGDGSCITHKNTLNAVLRCLNWCEVYIKDNARRLRNVSYLKTTIESIKSLCGLIAEGWRAEDDDYEAIGERLDNIMEQSS